MKLINPRAPGHRGSVEAVGFLIDPELIGLEKARERILSIWEPGVAVYRLDLGLVARLPHSRRVDSRRSPGLPLTQDGSLLVGLPLSPTEVESQSAEAGSILVAKAGVVSAARLEGAYLERAELWLDIDDYGLVETGSLGAPPAEPTLAVEPLEFDARSRMDCVPAESEDLLEFLKELKQGRSRNEAHGPAAGHDNFWNRLGLRLGRFLPDVASISGWTQGIGSSAGSGSKSRAKPAQQPSREYGFGLKLGAALRRLMMRALLAARLDSIFGRRQAAYLARLIDMLERGDTTEALKHAIPLGGETEKDLAALALGVPRPRMMLSINPWMTRASGTIGIGHDFMEYLRRLYRAAFERLSTQGRIEEAAFVLSELLFANEEAVAFLEKHGRLRLAAEMAEARELAAGTVVRQWFIAGDKERAIRIARRLNAFSAAVV